MPSLRARLIRYLARRHFNDINPDSDLGMLRARFEQMAGRMRRPRGIALRHATVAGIDCDWLVPTGCDRAPLLYYLHGGAYVMGSSRTHRALVGHIAKAAGVRAVLPNYRLAPEHRFPASIEDACAVYRRLLEQGEDPAQVAIGGDSAGGGLTMATLISLRDAGDPLPGAVLLLSPWLDLTASGESMRTRAELDPLFRPERMDEVADYYCERDEVDDPRVSPVFADVTGLPPVFIQVGDHEILLSDSTRLSDRLSAAGGDVTLQIWPDMWHVFQYFAGQMPEAKHAIRDIGDFLRRRLGTGN